MFPEVFICLEGRRYNLGEIIVFGCALFLSLECQHAFMLQNVCIYKLNKKCGPYFAVLFFPFTLTSALLFD